MAQSEIRDRKTEIIRVFDPLTGSVSNMAMPEYQSKLKSNHELTPAIPQRLVNTKQLDSVITMAVAHPDRDINRPVRTLLNRIQHHPSLNGNNELLGLAATIFYMPVDVIPEFAQEVAVYAGMQLERMGDRSARQLYVLADEIYDQSIPAPEENIRKIDTEQWMSFPDTQVLMTYMDEITLSTGESFREHRNNLIKQKAQAEVLDILGKISQPFEEVVSSTCDSIQSHLVDKANRLLQIMERISYIHNKNNLTDNELDLLEDQRGMAVEIIAMLTNIRNCDQFLSRKADYDTFEEIAKELKSQIQMRQADKDDNTISQPGPINLIDQLGSFLTDEEITSGQLNMITQVATKGLGDKQIDAPETELEAISSLQNQFKEVARKRNNALYRIKHINKDGFPEGLEMQARKFRLRRLSQETYSAEAIPLINRIASTRLADLLSALIEQDGIDLNTQEGWEKLFNEYNEYTPLSNNELSRGQRKAERRIPEVVVGNTALITLLRELQILQPGLSIDSLGFHEFWSRTYATSNKIGQLNTAKGEVMRIFVLALNEKLGINIQEEYATIIGKIANEIETEDLILVVEDEKNEAVIREMAQNLSTLLNYLRIPVYERSNFVQGNKEKLASVLLAYYEVTTLAYDEHLNSDAVLENIAEALFYDKPITLQIMRCLRWCYPNRELQFTPHAGDFYTLSADGKPIIRREAIEVAKLERFNKTVVQPIAHHGIPIKNVTLLCIGDMEIIGDGYNLNPDDPRCVDARLYIEDTKSKISQWEQIFGGKIPVEVLPLQGYNIKDESGNVLYFVEGAVEKFGRDKYETLVEESKRKYDTLFQDNFLNWLGYTSKSIERIIDTEHEHRNPFVSWWSRQRSRDYTRHYITFGLALGAVIATQEGPQLLTVSGNQYAARHFAFGHRLYPETKPLGITLYQSVNDGDQSALYRAMSEVVE